MRTKHSVYEWKQANSEWKTFYTLSSNRFAVVVRRRWLSVERNHSASPMNIGMNPHLLNFCVYACKDDSDSVKSGLKLFSCSLETSLSLLSTINLMTFPLVSIFRCNAVNVELDWQHSWTLVFELMKILYLFSFPVAQGRAMSPAQSEDSGLAADRGSTYVTISIARKNCQSMGITLAGE